MEKKPPAQPNFEPAPILRFDESYKPDINRQPSARYLAIREKVMDRRAEKARLAEERILAEGGMVFDSIEAFRAWWEADRPERQRRYLEESRKNRKG